MEPEVYLIDHWTDNAKKKSLDFMNNIKNIVTNLIIQMMKRKAMLGFGF